jgi:hypothetical protein
VEYNQSNLLKVRTLVGRPSTIELQELQRHKNTISIYLDRDDSTKLSSIFGPTQDWHIVFNEYGTYYAVRYRFFKKEDFLIKLNLEYPESFNWILFNPEVLSGEWNVRGLL